MGYDQDQSAKNRVLAVVEDERLRDTLDRGLARHGFGFTTAAQPEAVHAYFDGAADPEFDVLLFDVQPHLAPRTHQAVRQLRRAGVTTPAACLVSANLVSAFPLDQAIQLMLIKPIDLAELALELRRLSSPPPLSGA